MLDFMKSINTIQKFVAKLFYYSGFQCFHKLTTRHLQLIDDTCYFASDEQDGKKSKCYQKFWSSIMQSQVVRMI